MKKYPTYKDSGIQWIGEIPKHWEIRRLKSFADFINRGNAPSYVENGKIGVINQATFSSGQFDLSKLRFTEDCDLDAARGKVIKNDVLLASTGGGVLGKTALFDLSGEYMADSHVTIIRDSLERFNQKFLYFILSSNYELINGFLAQGSTNQTELQRVWLNDFKIPFPKKEEQTIIAEFLDKKISEIEQLIATKVELIQRLEAHRKAIINEVVTGQAYKTGLIPTPEGKEVKYKDSGVELLGEIPENWEVVKLKYLVSVKGRLGWKGLKAEEYIEMGFGFLSTPDVKNDKIDFENINFISEERYLESPEIMLENKDVLLVKDGSTLGIVNIIDELPIPTTVNSSIAVLRVIKNELLIPDFFKFFLESELSQGVINLLKGGQGVPHLFQSDIKNFDLLIPSFKEQKQIIYFLKEVRDDINDAISTLRLGIEKLKRYKQSLISEAVTGKIDLRNWQKD